MEWLNYHHLFYFWTVAREGSVTRASSELRLTQSTVSAQLKLLEDSLGEPLFDRVGRRLVLTDVGRVVLRYAEEIFTLGRELLDTVKDRPTGRPMRLNVGVADVLPKLLVHRLLSPALGLETEVRLVCVEGKPEDLLARLAVHQLDVVLADVPIGPSVHVRAFNHLLCESGISFFAAPALAKSLARRFPRSLEGSPMLLPTPGTTLRRSLEQWFESEEIRPSIASEFEDSALLKVFGAAGAGVFPVPTILEEEVAERFRVKLVGRTDAVRERYYAISVERRLKHPAVVAISEAARSAQA